VKYRGTIVCKTCRTVLNVSGEPVLEREKPWCERQSIFMCNPRCDHWTPEMHETNSGIHSRDAIEIVWEPWSDMYLIKTTTEKSDMTQPKPFGFGFAVADADLADKMEVWGTSINDPGPDYTEGRLLAANGAVLKTSRIDGY